MIFRLALAAALFATPALAERSLNGRTVTFRVLAMEGPGIAVFEGQGRTVQVGNGAEFGLDREGTQNGLDVVPVQIDISASRIELSYAGNPPGYFAHVWFNGYELSFPTECALILDAHLDMSGTTFPITDDDLTIEANRLRINVEGLAYHPEDRVAIDIDVGDCVIS